MRNLYYLLKMVRLSLPYKARKYITVLLFIMLGFFLFKSAYAVYDPNPKHSKWFHDSIVNDPLNKSSVEVKAQRTYPVTVVDPATGAKNTITKVQKSTIKLTPTATNVGKKLMKGGLGGVITQALIALGINAVTWVMDPENNRVKYTLPKDNEGTCAVSGFYTDSISSRHSTPESACSAAAASLGYEVNRVTNTGCNMLRPDGSFVTATIRNKGVCDTSDPTYQSTAIPRYVPIDTVAQKVIDNAASGDAPSMEVMTNTALDMLEQGLLDAQLEAAADPKKFGSNESDPLGGSSPTPDPETPTDPDGESPTPDPAPEAEPFELPPFCAWATKVCDFIDWVQTPPSDPEDGAGDIPVENPDPDMHVGILERLYINMPAECPPDPVLEFMGAKIPFPMSVFCQFASMMKPLILLFAYIKGLSIIGNGLN